MTDGEKEAIKRKHKVDDQMKTMIREILFYGVFLALLLIVANGQQDNNSYQQNSNFIQTLTTPNLANLVELF